MGSRGAIREPLIRGLYGFDQKLMRLTLSRLWNFRAKFPWFNSKVGVRIDNLMIVQSGAHACRSMTGSGGTREGKWILRTAEVETTNKP